MSDLLMALLGALMATNTALATSNLLQQQTGITMSVPNPDDPVEQEFERLLELDDEAQAEVDRWILENKAFAEAGGGLPNAELNLKILQRFEIVRTNYLEFLAVHTNHARNRKSVVSVW